MYSRYAKHPEKARERVVGDEAKEERDHRDPCRLIKELEFVSWMRWNTLGGYPIGAKDQPHLA